MPPETDEVWLFGSRARGESDGGSDVDVLVVSAGDAVPSRTRECLVREYGDGVDIAHYSYRGLATLVEQGALFAWHLRCEGVPIYRGTDRLAAMLSTMPPYRRHREDLEVLRCVLREAVASMACGLTVEFDLGVVATVIRNAGIIMTDLAGVTDYSPRAPLSLASIPGTPRLPLSASEYAYLASCRRASERGVRLQTMGSSIDIQHTRRLTLLARWLGDCIKYREEQGNGSVANGR